MRSPASRGIFGSQPSNVLALVISGRRCLGSSWKLVEANPALGARDRDYAMRAFENCELVGVADVHRKVLVGLRQSQESFYFIADVTEAAGLRAVAIHGEVVATQGLLHEIWNYTAIVQLHAWAVSIEDPCDPCVHSMVAVIGHGKGFGESLGLVVNRARTDGIDVAPVGFLLRVFEWIAVTLGSRRNQIFGAILLRDLENVQRSERAHFQRFNSVDHVIHRAGGRCQVKDVINFSAVELPIDVEL